MEKPAVKNIPSSFKRFWALQVPSLQIRLIGMIVMIIIIVIVIIGRMG